MVSQGNILGSGSNTVNFRPTTAAMGRGDRLLLYTDGISEQRNADRLEFGAGRLEEALRASGKIGIGRLSKQIFDDVAAHAKAPLTDDSTLLLIERRL